MEKYEPSGIDLTTKPAAIVFSSNKKGRIVLVVQRPWSWPGALVQQGELFCPSVKQ